MPRAVKEKAREIDALIEANAAAARGEPGEVADTGSAVDSESQDDADTQQGAEVLAFESNDQGVSNDAGTDQLAEIQRQLAAAQQAAETADQRWRSLDGQLRSKDEQIERLTQLVARMTEHTQPQPTAEPEAAGATKADADTFGDDMVDMVQRVAREAARREVAAVVNTLQGLEQKVNSVEQHTAAAVTDSFQTKLTRLAPTWEKYDTDEGFHQWLAESTTRQRLFREAADGRDAAGVAEFFNMYAAKVEAVAAPAQQAAQNKAQQLERQVAPGRSRSVRTPAQDAAPDEKTWTRTEIANNYAAYSSGKFTKEEWAKLELQMATAQKQNRVDYSR